MNDDMEDVLGRLAPDSPGEATRTRVLAAVDRELNRPSDAHRLRWAALASAAALMVSVGLNLWTDRSIDARLARVIGPEPMDRQALELANDIASVTDAETGRWFYKRIVSQRRSQQTYRQSVMEYQRISKDIAGLSGSGA